MGKNPEQILSINDQLAYEALFNITSYQRNANQWLNEA